MKFDSLNLSEDIQKAVREAGFEKCTPVQEQALPETLAGKDLIAQSQTGTGKTAVFLLTIFNRLKDKRPDGRPWALVMVPTRELAVQVEKDAVKLGKHLDFSSVAIYGGVEYEKQIPVLKKGVDLVVATPGRMIDLYKSKNLSLDGIEMFVVDEADRMFDMGFAPDIRYIANRLPKDLPRQTMLFSATIDHNVRRLSSRYMKKEAEEIEVDPEQVTVDKIDQKLIYTSNEEKVAMLMALLERPGVEKVLIFTNMKRTAEMVGWKLTENGYPAEVLTGDVNQNKRQKIIDGLKTGKVKMLVATDVAARGLHIEGVTHVVNFDLPEESASYVHRIGRTARAGESGKAWSLVCESHAFNLPDIEKYIERKIDSEWMRIRRYRRTRRAPTAGAGPPPERAEARAGAVTGEEAGSPEGLTGRTRGPAREGPADRRRIRREARGLTSLPKALRSPTRRPKSPRRGRPRPAPPRPPPRGQSPANPETSRSGSGAEGAADGAEGRAKGPERSPPGPKRPQSPARSPERSPAGRKPPNRTERRPGAESPRARAGRSPQGSLRGAAVTGAHPPRGAGAGLRAPTPRARPRSGTARSSPSPRGPSGRWRRRWNAR